MNMKRILIFLLSWLACGISTFALVEFREINSPDQLPKGLRVESHPARDGEGLIDVTIRFVPEAPETYRGRVNAHGQLKVKLGKKTVTVASLKFVQDSEAFVFSFQLAREAFEKSELTLSTQLHEQDGHPTLGGGKFYHLRLNGFHPADKAKAPPAPL